MKKKILFIFPRLGIGGVSKALAFVAETMYQSGYEVVCISLSAEKKTVRLNELIKVYQINYLNRVSPLNFRDKIGLLYKLRKKIINISPDVICVFRVDLVRIVVTAIFGLKIDIIGSERENPYNYDKKKKRKKSKALEK